MGWDVALQHKSMPAKPKVLSLISTTKETNLRDLFVLCYKQE